MCTRARFQVGALTTMVVLCVIVVLLSHRKAGRPIAADSQPGERMTVPLEASAQAYAPPTGNTGCLAGEAFCETFDGAASPAAPRTGALDPARWSVSRLSQDTNGVSGVYNHWLPTERMFCTDALGNMVMQDGILPPDDSFMCNSQGKDSMHWMEAINDDDGYVYDSARIRQPFDFAGRSGTIALDVDLYNEGPHGFWTELWITDQPVPAPHSVKPGTAALPQTGIGLAFNQACGTGSPCTGDQTGEPCGSGNPQASYDKGFPTGLASVGEVHLVSNHVDSQPALAGQGCVLTASDHRQHVEVRLGQGRLEVWAADAEPFGTPRTNFHQIYSQQLGLPLSRGYVSLEHVAYAAEKFGTPADAMHTYHWDNVGFDGPQLTADRGYDVPDAMAPLGDGSLNLGYHVDQNGTSFTLAGVDLSGVTAASLNLDIWGYFASSSGVPGTVTYALNGHAPQTVTTATGSQDWQTLSLPVRLSDLAAGTNTLSLSVAGGYGQMVLTNLDLTLVDPRGTTPTP